MKVNSKTAERLEFLNKNYGCILSYFSSDLFYVITVNMYLNYSVHSDLL